MAYTFGGQLTPREFFESHFKRRPRDIDKWITDHRRAVVEAYAMSKDPGQGLDALDGLSTAKLARTLGTGSSRERASPSQVFGMARRYIVDSLKTEPVFVGRGAYGLVFKVPVTPRVSAALKIPEVMGLRPSIPAKTSHAAPTGSVLIKLAPSTGSRVDVLDELREIRAHAYLSSTRKANPSMPVSSQYVPKYFAGGYVPAFRFTVTLMEYVPGPTLKSVSRLSPKQFAQLEMAFISLWARGIYHSDAHSGNVILGPDSPKIVDFGFATVLPHRLVPRSINQALSNAWVREVDEYIQAAHVWNEFHNPDTRALRYVRRRKVSKGRTNSIRRHRILRQV